MMRVIPLQIKLFFILLLLLLFLETWERLWTNGQAGRKFKLPIRFSDWSKVSPKFPLAFQVQEFK